MNVIKKALYGILAGVFIFILASFGEMGGIQVFSPGFVGIGGLMLLLVLAPLEIIFDTYE